jgi:electron transport complex protein RnfB
MEFVMGSSLFVVSIVSLALLALFFAVVLAIADNKLRVEEDPRIEQLLEILPGSNEGACGFTGCYEFAEAVVRGDAAPNGCKVGGQAVADEVAKIMGIENQAVEKNRIRILCGGGKEEAKEKASYHGIKDCQAANLVGGGSKTCTYGCLGYGTCVDVCPFGALSMGVNGLPIIDDHKCTRCGLCIEACPRKIIVFVPEKSEVYIACSSNEKGAVVRKLCTVGCIGCGKCVKVCPPQAITLENNLAAIDYGKCDNCGLCIEECPTKTIVGEYVKAEVASLV